MSLFMSPGYLEGHVKSLERQMNNAKQMGAPEKALKEYRSVIDDTNKNISNLGRIEEHNQAFEGVHDELNQRAKNAAPLSPDYYKGKKSFYENAAQGKGRKRRKTRARKVKRRATKRR